MKRLFVALLLVGVTLPLLFGGSSTRAASDAEIETAIQNGLTWLADQQDQSGGASDGAWNLNYYPVASTAFAVLKFEHHARYTRDPTIDPFDPAYEYKTNIEKGLKYIFEHAVSTSINMEHGVDNPDVNLVNGQGVYFLSTGALRPLYETGIVMMALEASNHPEFTVVAPGSPVDTWSYEDVMKDTVDYVAWAQNDDPNAGRGGWRYGAYDDGAAVGPWLFTPGGTSDNSVSQWPALGLMSAEAWGANAPAWVKSELLDHWLVYSQNAGGFGYTSSAGPNIARTAAGLIQLTYSGVTADDARWAGGAQWICTNWGTSSPHIGHQYSMYGVMKAAMTAQPQPPNPVWDFCGHEWQPEYDQWLIDNQRVETDFTPEDPEYGSWAPEYDITGVLATEWALLILQKVVPPVPTPVPGVGGTAELLVDGSVAPRSAAEGSGSSAPLYAAIASAAVVAFAASGWYVRRRLS